MYGYSKHKNIKNDELMFIVVSLWLTFSPFDVERVNDNNSYPDSSFITPEPKSEADVLEFWEVFVVSQKLLKEDSKNKEKAEISNKNKKGIIKVMLLITNYLFFIRLNY